MVCDRHINLYTAADAALCPLAAGTFRIIKFTREYDLTNTLWLLKEYAIPAGMYANQVWATPFLRQGKERQSFTKMADDIAREDSDGQIHNPFMVRHARVWSRASTVQLVTSGSAAIQCSNPGMERSPVLDF